MNVKLQVGDKAPNFDLELADGGRITLSDLLGSKAVIWFYPAANTLLCTKQACDLRDSFEELTLGGARILGISPDQPEDAKRFIDEQELPFPLAVDPSHKVMEAYGAWGEKNMYGKIVEGVIRSTFVIDEHGVLIAVKYRVGTPKHVAFVRGALG